MLTILEIHQKCHKIKKEQKAIKNGTAFFLNAKKKLVAMKTSKNKIIKEMGRNRFFFFNRKPSQVQSNHVTNGKSKRTRIPREKKRDK